MRDAKRKENDTLVLSSFTPYQSEVGEESSVTCVDIGSRCRCKNIQILRKIFVIGSYFFIVCLKISILLHCKNYLMIKTNLLRFS